MRSSDTRAGAYAAARYELGLSSWRRGTRRLLLLYTSPFIAASLVALYLDQDWVAWVAGVVFGVYASIWIFIRDTPPPYVEDWARGAEGERKTAKVIAHLQGPDWHVVHDLEAQYGNYDHVVVGRAGVFLLETKNPRQGQIEIQGRKVLLRQRHLPDRPKRLDHIHDQVLRDAARLGGEIQQRVGHRPWVQAVVVIWCDFPQGFVEDRRCVYLHGTRVADWLVTQRARHGEHFVRSAAEALEAIAAAPHPG